MREDCTSTASVLHLGCKIAALRLQKDCISIAKGQQMDSNWVASSELFKRKRW